MTRFLLSMWHRYPECAELHRYLHGISIVDPAFAVKSFDIEDSLGYQRITLVVTYIGGTKRIRVQEQISFVFKSSFAIPTACKGCNFYHGKQGVICAVHPAGVATVTCKDWEEVMQ